MLGGLWTFATPLLMLGLYSVVFGGLFKSRFDVPAGAPRHVLPPFTVIVFAGLVWANVFLECLNRSAGLMLETPAYIKKVVFPLEIMPYVALVSSLIIAFTSLAVLLAVYGITLGVPPVTVLWTPVIVTPLMVMCLGMMWFFGSLGVYLRDLRQVIALVAVALSFLSPQFYPLSAVPEQVRPLIWLNPLTTMLEEVRNVTFWGWMPRFGMLALYAAISWLFAWAGLVWYSKVHRGFADVV